MQCQLQNDLQTKWHKLTLTNSIKATDPSDVQHAVLLQCLCAASYKTSLLWIQSSFEGRFCLNKTPVKLMNKFFDHRLSSCLKTNCSLFWWQSDKINWKGRERNSWSCREISKKPWYILPHWRLLKFFVFHLFGKAIVSSSHTPLKHNKVKPETILLQLWS